MILWKNLNHVMDRHGISNLEFKGFMANSAQANWNVIRIVYGSGDPKVPIDDCGRTCFFHWIQLLEKYTKQFILHDLQDQHSHLCLQYCNAHIMEEAEMRYSVMGFIKCHLQHWT